MVPISLERKKQKPQSNCNLFKTRKKKKLEPNQKLNAMHKHISEQTDVLINLSKRGVKI